MGCFLVAKIEIGGLCNKKVWGCKGFGWRGRLNGFIGSKKKGKKEKKVKTFGGHHKQHNKLIHPLLLISTHHSTTAKLYVVEFIFFFFFFFSSYSILHISFPTQLEVFHPGGFHSLEEKWLAISFAAT